MAGTGTCRPSERGGRDARARAGRDAGAGTGEGAARGCRLDQIYTIRTHPVRNVERLQLHAEHDD